MPVSPRRWLAADPVGDVGQQIGDNDFIAGDGVASPIESAGMAAKTRVRSIADATFISTPISRLGARPTPNPNSIEQCEAASWRPFGRHNPRNRTLARINRQVAQAASALWEICVDVVAGKRGDIADEFGWMRRISESR